MSEVVENQIVKMSFDNKDFEKNIDTSIKSLENLKDSLDFSGESGNFKELEKAANSLNFDGANKAIDNINDHFTILGRTAYKVADSIAEYFSSKLIGAFNKIKSVSTDLIDVKAGYSKYDEYTRSVKTIMSALGEEDKLSFAAQGVSQIEGVEKALSDLMLYTDETSYSFNAMADTIGKFMGAGISLESAVQDMQGIANWAALAGQNATVASQSMYQMSQALGRGNVQYSDWKEMANIKNMGTVEAKSVFIEAAQKKGTIRNEDIAKAKSIKGANATDAEVNNWFFESEQLNDQAWFTTDVLEEGLHMMSLFSNEAIALVNNYDDLEISASDLVRQFDKYKKAVENGADETKTFKEVTDTLLAGVDKSSDTYKEVYAKLELMASAEYDVGFRAFKAAQQAVTFSDAIEATRDAVGTKFVGIFDQIVGNYEEAAIIWTDLSNALWDIFAGPLDSILSSTKDWKYEISEANGEMTNYQYLWDGIYRVLGGISKVVGTLKNSFLSALFGREELSAGELVVDLLNRLAKKLNNLGDVLEGLYTTVELCFDAITGETQTVELVTSPFLQSLMHLLYTIGSILRSGLTIIKKVTDAILEGVFGGLKANNVLTSLVTVLDDLLMPVSALLSSIVDSKGFNVALELLTKTIKLLISLIKKLISPIVYIANILTNVIQNAIYIVIDLIDSAVSLFQGDIKEATDYFGTFSNFIRSGVEKIGNLIGVDLVKYFDKFSSFFGKFFIKFGTFFSSLVSGVVNEFPKEFNKMVEAFQNGSAGEKIKSVFVLIGNSILDGINVILDAIEKATGADFSGFKKTIIDFVKDTSAKLDELTPGFENTWDNLKVVFGVIKDIFSQLVDLVFDILGRVTGIENFGPENIIDFLLLVFEKLVTLAGWFITTVAKAVVMMGPMLEAMGTALLKGFNFLYKAFAWIAEKDKSPEALKAFENVKKVIIVAIVVLGALEIRKLLKAITWMAESIGQIGDLFSGMNIHSIYGMVITGVKYIVLILLAIGFLSNQDIGGIAMAVIALGVMLKLITNAFKRIILTLEDFFLYMKKHKITVGDKVEAINSLAKIITKLGISALLIAVGIRIMVGAFKGKHPEAGIYAVISLGVLIVALSFGVRMIIKASKKLDPDGLKQVTKLVAKITSEVMIIAYAISFVSKQIIKILDSENGEGALIYFVIIVGGFLIALTAATSIISKISVNVKTSALKSVRKLLNSIAIDLIAMILAFGVISTVLETLVTPGINALIENIKGFWNSLTTTGDKVIVVTAVIALIAFVAALFLLHEPAKAGSKQAKKTSKQLVEFGKNLAGVGVGVVAIAASSAIMIAAVLGLNFIFKHANIELGTFVASLLTFAAVVGGLVLVAKVLSKVDVKSSVKQFAALAIGILSIALATTMIVSSLMLLTVITADSDSYMPGVKAIGLIMLALTVIAVIFSSIKGISSTLKHLSSFMTGFAFSVLIIVAALYLISDVDEGVFTKAELIILTIIVTLAVLAAMAPMLGPVTALLNALGKAMLFAALGIAIFLVIIAGMALLEGFADTFVDSLNALTEKLPVIVEALVNFISVLLGELGKSLSAHAEQIAEGLWLILEALLEIIAVLLVKLGNLIGNLIVEGWTIIKPYLEAFWQKIKEWAKAGWDAIKAGAKAAWDFFVEIVQNIGKGIVDGLKLVAGTIYAAAVAIWDLICLPFQAVWDLGYSIGKGFHEGFNAILDWILGGFKGAGEAILKFFTHPFDTIRDIGKNLLLGLWNGIVDIKDWIVNKVKGIGKDIINCFKDVFGIHSPSTVLKAIGGFLMDGLSEGLSNKLGEVVGNVTGIGDTITGAFSDSISLDNLFPDMNSMIPEVEFDATAVAGFDANTLGLSDVYDMDVSAYYRGSGVDIPTNYEPTITDGQLSQLSSSYDDSNQSVVDAITELKKQMAEMTEQIKSYQMVLDTGVLVGELAAPMDKALGTKNRLAGRGV